MTSRRGLLLATAGGLFAGVAGVNVWRSGDVALSPEDGPGVGEVSVPVSATDERTEFGIDLAGTPIFGSLDADVDVYYWSDYQCPHCQQFRMETLPKLLANEVSDGTARIATLEYPVLGEQSMLAAVAAKCVWSRVKDDDPEAFRRWHAAIFEAQEEPRSGWVTRDRLRSISASVDGVDADAVDRCLNEDRNRMKSRIHDEASAASANGIDATPGFVVYDPADDESGTIIGAEPYRRFSDAIDELRRS